jgi:hypothetical protein
MKRPIGSVDTILFPMDENELSPQNYSFEFTVYFFMELKYGVLLLKRK